MQVRLSPQLKREMAGVKEYGYRSEKEFIEDAVRHWAFELKKEKKIATVKLSPAQKRDLAQARKELARGEYVSLKQLKYDLGITG